MSASVRSWPFIVDRVVDGDTLHGALDLGLGLLWTGRRVRLRDVNAPELSTASGRDALAYVAALISPGTAVTATVHTAQPVDNYGRTLAAITLPDGTDLATRLLESGHAVSTPSRLI
ncbi:thermonuclease family protein [Frankia sp. Cj3]|uniref:thermonuclease family protein n=1 Tax=Frankia sp. Cj3 TaxID=2880976 RepID=UPI001EF40B87|nr:thermonuclease family protein [Frankia sp. Cj3]